MEFVVASVVIVFAVWWLFTAIYKKKTSNPQQGIPEAPAYMDYCDDLENRPVQELKEDERIIRDARDSFDAERKARSAEYHAKQNALAADKNKITRATDFVRTSYLSLALPYVQKATKHWPSWSKMDSSRWTAPMPLSDVEESKFALGEPQWVQFRPTGGPLYKIEFKQSQSLMPTDDNMEYGSITLFVDDEEVLGMCVNRDLTNEWSTWDFEVVESLKVGPWIREFMAFYNRLRSAAENESEDRSIKYLRDKAAKIDLGEGS